MGHASTLDYVAAAAAAVLQETGLVPHINAGVMGEADLRRCARRSAASAMGLAAQPAPARGSARPPVPTPPA